MKMKSIISLLVTSSVFFSGIAYAAEKPQIQFEGSNIIISGKAESEYPYPEVTIRVQKSNAVNADDFIYLMQQSADEEGSYEFVINMEDYNIGKYPYKIIFEDEKIEDNIIYITAEKKKEILTQINNAKSYEEMLDIIDISDENSDDSIVFGIDDSIVFKVPQEEVYKVFYNLNSQEQINPEDEKQFRDKIILSAVIAALNNGVQFDILEYSDILGLDKEFVDIYNKSFLKETKEKFTASFKNENLKNTNDVSDSFKNHVILTMINEPSGWSDIATVLEKYSDLAGVGGAEFKNLTKKNQLAAELADEAPFSSLDDFKRAYDSLYPSYSPSANKPYQGGGSGGGGGKGSTSKFSNDIQPAPISPEVIENVSEFSDINEAAWAKEYINELYSKNIVSGTGNNKFLPNREIKREEFVKILVSALNIENSSENPTFSDVDENDWFYPYVSSAYKCGIAKGYPDGTFGSGKYITRQDAFYMAHNAAAYCGYKFDLSSAVEFEDKADISEYASNAVSALAGANIINGYKNMINPKAYVTRAQIAKIVCLLMRFGGVR